MISAPQLVIELLQRLSDLNIEFMVGGSFASSAWGQPRQTNDLDLAVLLDTSQTSLLHDATRVDYMGSEEHMQEALDSSSAFRSFQLLHFEETFKIDFFVLERTEYVMGSLARAKSYELAPGRFFPFTSAEDIVIVKLRWFLLGNRVSDRQWNDIVQILEIQQRNLDDEYLDRWCQFFGVYELLVEARSQAIPIGEGSIRDGRSIDEHLPD